MSKVTNSCLEDIGGLEDIGNSEDGVRAYSTSNDNLILLPEIKEQVLVLKGISLGSESQDFKNQIIPIVNKLKDLFTKIDIDLKLVSYEQPFYSDTITKEELLQTPYDLFFSIEMETILSSREKFIEFMIMKDRANLLLLEDIVITNPVYQRDPWYSDDINKLVCWHTTKKMTDDIQEKFGMILKQIKAESKSSKELANMFSSVSNIPVYCKNIVGIKEGDIIYKIISMLQMANVFTQKELNEFGIRENDLETEERLDLLFDIVNTISEGFIKNPKNLSRTDSDIVFNHTIPLIYKKFLVLGILDKEPELKNTLAINNEDTDELLKFLEQETMEFIVIMKEVLKGVIKPPFKW